MAPTPAQTDDLGELLRLIRRDEFTRDLKPAIAKKSNSYCGRRTPSRSWLVELDWRIRMPTKLISRGTAGTFFPDSRTNSCQERAAEYKPVGPFCRIRTRNSAWNYV